MKWNNPERQKIDRQNSWQRVKHARLHFRPLQALKREPSILSSEFPEKELKVKRVRRSCRSARARRSNGHGEDQKDYNGGKNNKNKIKTKSNHPSGGSAITSFTTTGLHSLAPSGINGPCKAVIERQPAFHPLTGCRWPE